MRLTVEVLGPVAYDRHGESVETVKGTIANVVVANTALAADAEQNDNRNRTSTGLRLFAPPSDVEITAHDKIRFPDGTVWDVEGEPGVWDSPFSDWNPGYEIRIRRVTG